MIGYVLSHYDIFFLVLLRMVAFIGASPVVSMQSWPVSAKLGLAFFIAMFVTPTIQGHVPSAFLDPGQYIVAAVLESVTGLLLGFIATLVFSALSIAGQMVDIQVGFSQSQLFDPTSSQSSGLIGSFHSMLFTLYFLGMNGLDGLSLAVMDSYRFVPIGHFHASPDAWQILIQMLSMVMVIAVQFVAPILVALLLTDITFAFLSRAVPQMNVYVVGLPAKLFVGLSLYVLIMPGIIYLFSQLFNMVFSQMNALLQFIGG